MSQSTNSPTFCRTIIQGNARAVQTRVCDFWKSIGRVGVRDNRQKDIPMEVLDQIGNVKNNSNTVFDKWRTEFSLKSKR